MLIFQTGLLTLVVKEVQGLIRDQLRKEAQGQCSTCGRSGSEDRLHLEQQVHSALESVDKINIELNETKEKLKAKVSCSYYYFNTMGYIVQENF